MCICDRNIAVYIAVHIAEYIAVLIMHIAPISLADMINKWSELIKYSSTCLGFFRDKTRDTHNSDQEVNIIRSGDSAVLPRIALYICAITYLLVERLVYTINACKALVYRSAPAYLNDTISSAIVRL